MSKVSICLCTYNGEEFLKQLLDSLIHQTRCPNEIVICDDCSTDNTGTIIDEYKANFPLIEWNIVINDNNLGWRENFKKCISLSTGDYIFLCDQDDIWNNDKLVKMLDIIENNDSIGLLACSYHVFYDNSSHVKIKQPSINEKIKPIRKNKYFMTPLRPGCTYCFKAYLKEKLITTWESSFAHDAMLWRISFLERKLYVFNYSGINFRRHSNNASSCHEEKFSKEKYHRMKDGLRMSLRCLENLNRLFPDSKLLQKQTSFYVKRLEAYKTGSTTAIFRLLFYFKYYFSVKEMLKDCILAKKYGGEDLE